MPPADTKRFRILMVAASRESLAQLAAALAGGGRAEIQWAASGAAAQEGLAGFAPHLVIMDENLGDMSGLELARMITLANPFVNTALVSSLSEDEFHEISEGLGILARLPAGSGSAEADALLDQLAKCVF